MPSNDDERKGGHVFDAKKLLEQVLGPNAGALGGTAQRMLGELTGGQGGQVGAARSGRGMDLAGGALAGGALGLLLGSKKARKTAMKFGGTAVKVGGLALVAGLAYKAYTTWQQGQGGQGPAAAPGAAAPSGPKLLPPPSESPFDPEKAPEGANARAEHVLVAMIAAAKADGHIDAEEQGRIFGHLDSLGLDTEAKAFVMDELRAPLDVERVVRLATDEASRAEIYAASLLAMDPDTPAERAWLDLLAARLGLDRALALEIERTTSDALAG